MHYIREKVTNLTLYALSAFVISLGILAPLQLRKYWIDGHPESTAPIRTSEDVRSGGEEIAPVESEDRIDFDGIRLQRIQKVVNLEANPPLTQPEPPTAKQAPPFQGRLIGTIIDDDPKFSFAVIQLPNSKVKLVRNSTQVDELFPEVTIQEIGINRVVLMSHGFPQVLELHGSEQQ